MGVLSAYAVTWWVEDPLPAVLGVLLAWLVTVAIVTVQDRTGR